MLSLLKLAKVIILLIRVVLFLALFELADNIDKDGHFDFIDF